MPTSELPVSPAEYVGTLPLQKIGGPACTIALTEQLLTLGAYIRIFPFPPGRRRSTPLPDSAVPPPSSTNGTATNSRCSALDIDAGSCHIQYGSEATEQRRRSEYPWKPGRPTAAGNPARWYNCTLAGTRTPRWKLRGIWASPKSRTHHRDSCYLFGLQQCKAFGSDQSFSQKFPSLFPFVRQLASFFIQLQIMVASRL